MNHISVQRKARIGMNKAMEWKELAINDLKPAAYNPRKKLKAGDKEYEKIKNSILEFGYV